MRKLRQVMINLMMLDFEQYNSCQSFPPFCITLFWLSHNFTPLFSNFWTYKPDFHLVLKVWHCALWEMVNLERSLTRGLPCKHFVSWSPHVGVCGLFSGTLTLVLSLQCCGYHIISHLFFPTVDLWTWLSLICLLCLIWGYSIAHWVLWSWVAMFANILPVRFPVLVYRLCSWTGFSLTGTFPSLSI